MNPVPGTGRDLQPAPGKEPAGAGDESTRRLDSAGRIKRAGTAGGSPEPPARPVPWEYGHEERREYSLAVRTKDRAEAGVSTLWATRMSRAVTGFS